MRNKLSKLNRCGFLWLLILELVVALGAMPVGVSEAAEAEHADRRSSVVTIFYDRIPGEHPEVVNLITEMLKRKTDEIYRIVPETTFLTEVRAAIDGDVNAGDTSANAIDDLIIEILRMSKADFAILATLEKFSESGAMGVFRLSKKTNAQIGIRIYNLAEKSVIKKVSIERNTKDDNAIMVVDGIIAALVISSADVTTSAMDRILFQAGEIISVNLPLKATGRRMAY